MTHLIHLESQHLCTKMMQCVTPISHDMHVCTPFHTPYFLFFILYLLISHILTDMVYFVIYTRISYIQCVYT